MDPENNDQRERAVEAVAALLQSAPAQRMQVTNLNKALFYLDLAALRDTGATLTECVYLALPQGPVMHGYKDQLIPEMTKRGIVRQDEDGMAQPVVLVAPLTSYQYMDDRLRALAAQIAPYIAGQTATSVSNQAHKNPGWRSAYAKSQKRNSAPAPINMYVAMQQVATEDPWLNEPMDDALSDVFNKSESQPGSSW